MSDSGCMVTLLAVLCSTLATPAARSPLAQTFPAGKLKRVRVESTGGSIKVRGIQTEHVAVTGQRTLGDAGCRIQTQRTADSLTIRVGDATQAPCQMDLDLPLPRQLDVAIQSESGTLFASGTQGSLDVTLGKGSAVLGGKIRQLTAHLGEGSLSAQGLTGDANVSLTAGNAQLWYVTGAAATVSVEVARGNVTVGADVAAIDAQVNLESGQLQCTLPQDAQAPLHIRGHIAHGNVIVRAAKR